MAFRGGLISVPKANTPAVHFPAKDCISLSIEQNSSAKPPKTPFSQQKNDATHQISRFYQKIKSRYSGTERKFDRLVKSERPEASSDIGSRLSKASESSSRQSVRRAEAAQAGDVAHAVL